MRSATKADRSTAERAMKLASERDAAKRYAEQMAIERDHQQAVAVAAIVDANRLAAALGALLAQISNLRAIEVNPNAEAWKAWYDCLDRAGAARDAHKVTYP